MTYSLLWLPDVLAAAGLTVAPVDGWQHRGRGDLPRPLGVMCHHTAGRPSGNMPALATLRDGRPDLPGPLAQLGLGRDGTYYVIAAGRANHAGVGSWHGITRGNQSVIGIEAENTGLPHDSPWPKAQMVAYARGVAAILAHLGLSEQYCVGHKEYALPRGRKVDPSFDMDKFRAAVADILRGNAGPPTLIPAAESTSSDAVPRRTLRRGEPADRPLLDLLQSIVGARPTGYFDAQTEAAVRRFQRTHQLVPDGRVGPLTWAALDRAKTD